MTITINETDFEAAELNVKRADRCTSIRYNTQGDMLIDLVNKKYELDVTFGLLSESEMSELRSLCGEIFVSVSFPAPDGVTTAEFHISEEPAPCISIINGVKTYSAVKLKFLEK